MNYLIFKLHTINGDDMKYVLNIIILFIFVVIITNITNNQDNAISVLSLDDNFYQIYDIYTNNLSTKHIDKYFSNTTNFMAVYPKVNVLYKDRVGDISYKCQNNFDINDFVIYYKSILEKNNFYQDLINIDYYGVNIEKIKVYASKEELDKILQKCTICSVASN